MTLAEAFMADSRLRSQFIGHAQKLLETFARIPLREFTRFPSRGIVNHDNTKILFLGTGEVYAGSQLVFRLDAACGPSEEPLCVVEAT